MDAQSGASLFGPKPYSGVAHKARPFSYYLSSVKLKNSAVVQSSTQDEKAAGPSEKTTELAETQAGQNEISMPLWEKSKSTEEARDRFQIRYFVLSDAKSLRYKSGPDYLLPERSFQHL